MLLPVALYSMLCNPRRGVTFATTMAPDDVARAFQQQLTRPAPLTRKLAGYFRSVSWSFRGGSADSGWRAVCKAEHPIKVPGLDNRYDPTGDLMALDVDGRQGGAWVYAVTMEKWTDYRMFGIFPLFAARQLHLYYYDVLKAVRGTAGLQAVAWPWSGSKLLGWVVFFVLVIALVANG